MASLFTQRTRISFVGYPRPARDAITTSQSLALAAGSFLSKYLVLVLLSRGIANVYSSIVSIS
jgi:hypothetical protein